MDADPPGNSIRVRARNILTVSYMLMYGLLMSLMSAQWLLSGRSLSSGWRYLFIPADVVLLLWIVVAGWQSFHANRTSTANKEDAFTFLVAIVAGIAVWLMKIPWSTALVGIAFAALFLGIGWIRRRSYYAGAAGWLLCGFAVFRFWPSSDEHTQMSLLLLMGGIVTALQGAWDLMKCLQVQTVPVPATRE